ncbi:MAG: integration host factor subunit alpha [Alphaproteobacteria bacterium]|jgi:integration host factor subunit alpha|nr:integration host factor subunit alpha [Rickettsiales bacterium]
MTQKTLTRADLSNSVYREIGLSLSESTQLVDAVLEEVSAALTEGNAVKLSSFGTFRLRRKKQRIGRNPKTGVEVPITPRTVLSFNASNILKSRVNGETPGTNRGE